jgi:hypothetical protein
MWWPNPWEQPLEDIAHYDWVILGPWEAEFIAPLRELNPDILLLSSTNACEIIYAPDASDDPERNEIARSVPPEWFLTQVGSTLVAPVGETEVVLRLADLTASDGSAVGGVFPEAPYSLPNTHL